MADTIRAFDVFITHELLITPRREDGSMRLCVMETATERLQPTTWTVWCHPGALWNSGVSQFLLEYRLIFPHLGATQATLDNIRIVTGMTVHLPIIEREA